VLLAVGIGWACLATMWGVRALWPVRRRLGKLRLAELAAGLTALVTLAVGGQHGSAGYVVTGCLIVALLCAIPAQAARRGWPLFRYRRRSLAASHLYLWVDALAPAVAAAAAGHAAGDALPYCLPVPVSLAVGTAAVQSVKLERRKEGELWQSARPLRLALASAPARAPERSPAAGKSDDLPG
jgi:hypothetical protein